MNSFYLAPPIFFVIAFVFSMLGMGGSQLYIPILYWMGMDFKTEAIPLGMLLNLVNSSSAAITYGRKKLIDWGVAIPFAAAMILFAPLGVWFNMQLPVKPLLVFFALFTAAAAILMLSGWKPKRGELSKNGRVVLGLSAGSGLGMIAGLIGRGGGSFVVPLLYIAGLDAKMAAATSSLVVTSSGLSSFVSHLATAANPQWTVWITTVLAVLLGSQLGSRLMAGRMKPKVVKQVFGWVLLGVAALIIIKDVILG
ncbi:MAG: sulfite exporter TauE/SafE family protein [Anaerolineaceae bacterium]|nr:sulfite exporter TauE/SafE family protein [Anaerolineaceae bacterium]